MSVLPVPRTPRLSAAVGRRPIRVAALLFALALPGVAVQAADRAAQDYPDVVAVKMQARDQKHGYGGKSVEVVLPGR